MKEAETRVMYSDDGGKDDKKGITHNHEKLKQARKRLLLSDLPERISPVDTSTLTE